MTEISKLPLSETTLSQGEWRAVVTIMRSAPLDNMQHAEIVDRLTTKVLKHAGLIAEPAPVQGDMLDEV